MKVASSILILGAVWLWEDSGFSFDIPSISGRIGLESTRVPDDTASAYDRVYSHVGLDGAVPFRVGRSKREILYSVGLRAWLTRSSEDPRQTGATSPPSSEENSSSRDQIEPEVLLEKAVLEYQRRRWRFRLGQQELALGEVLGPSVIDLANARDYRQADQFLKSTDRLPHLMGLLEYKRRRYGIQIFASPRPSVMKLPDRLLGFPIVSEFDSSEPEYGFRYNYFFRGLDLKLYGLHHQNRSPILVPSVSLTGLQYLALQRYENSFASTFNYAWDYVVLRGELIRTVGQKTDLRDITADQVDQAVLALDYTSENQILLVGQVQTIAPSGCTDEVFCDSKQLWGGGQIQVPWFDHSMTTSVFLYRRLDQGTLYQKLEILWNVSDSILANAVYEKYEGFSQDGLAFLDQQDRFLINTSYVF